MIEKWGITTIKLDKQNHYGQKENIQKANYKAIIKEAIDRYGSDPDIDHSKSDENMVFLSDEFADLTGDKTEITGDDLIAYYDSLTDQHRDARGHKFRRDGIVAGAGIIKPAIDDKEWKRMTRYQKIMFLYESVNGFMRSFKDNSVKFDLAIIHFDEPNPHIHIFYHDETFDLSRKVGLKFREELHRGEFVSYMSEQGYELMPHGKSQKKGGKSSSKYKAEKEAERIREDARKEVEQMKQAAEQERINIIRQGQAIKERLISEGKQEQEKLISEGEKVKNAFKNNGKSDKYRKLMNGLRTTKDSIISEKQFSDISVEKGDKTGKNQNLNQSDKVYDEYYELVQMEKEINRKPSL